MKKIFILCLALIMMLGTFAVYAADAPAFEDIENSWAKNEITAMRDLGIITGKTATQFAPGELVTRAEFAVMIARICAFDSDYSQSMFNDVAIDSWYGQAVNAAYFEGIVKGDDKNNFMPNSPVSLQEAAVMANRVFTKYHPDDTSAANTDILNGFKNLESVSQWAREDIAYAAQRGILYRLYENGYFDGTRSATREETASILYRLYNTVK